MWTDRGAARFLRGAGRVAVLLFLSSGAVAFAAGQVDPGGAPAWAQLGFFLALCAMAAFLLGLFFRVVWRRRR